MRKFFTLLLVLTSLTCFSQSTTLVISQFYGAGGNTGASLNADYVELHNVSSGALSLSGYSIQYSSATNTGAWTGVSALPAVSIPAGGYYLIQMGGAGANGAALPTPDYFANPTIALSGTNGKLALVNGTTAITGCPFPANVIDGVGYGTANCFEGAAATAALTPTDAGLRNNSGCTDTDNSGSDFTVTAAAPRNSATPVFICSGGPPTPSITAGTVVDFGNVVIATNSPSQFFNITGSNLTGAPGDITINAPSVDFEVSNDNSAWGASTLIHYTTASLPATPVYVRFSPQTLGPKSGNVNIIGGGVSGAVTVAVSGNCVATAVANVTTSPATTAFGAVCINTIAGPNIVSINGTNLTTADLVVGPLNGYSFSTTSGGTYTATLTLPQPGGTFNQDIFVQFTPTTAASYDGNIPVTGGGLSAAASIVVTGTGTSGTATVVTGSPSAITQTSATLAGTIPLQGCSPVTAYGFEYSVTAGFPAGTGTVAASSNLSGVDFSADISLLLPGTTYYYMAFATNTGGTVYGTQMSFITSAPPASSLDATALSSFGSTCVTIAVGPNSFDINGINLTTADIVVGPLNGFTFSTTSGGPYSNSLTLPQSGGTYSQTIYVMFNPAVLGVYDGNIPVTGGGVASFSVPVSGSGENTVPALVTGDATDITANEASVTGGISNFGCSSVFAYGFEYSGINGFVNGSGIKKESFNLTGPDFSTRLTGLVKGTTYYYRAYATNNGGTSYGPQNSFTTASIPQGLVIYSSPIIRGQSLHFSVSGLKAGHYLVVIHDGIGQRMLQRDFIVQVDFMDNSFTLPANFPIGVYNLQVLNYNGFKMQKSFMVQ